MKKEEIIQILKIQVNKGKISKEKSIIYQREIINCINKFEERSKFLKGGDEK